MHGYFLKDCLKILGHSPTSLGKEEMRKRNHPTNDGKMRN